MKRVFIGIAAGCRPGDFCASSGATRSLYGATQRKHARSARHFGPPNQMNRMPAGGRATSDRGTGTGSQTRAHHRRHAVQSARNPSAGGSAEQLNREEVARFQSNNPSSMNRMPAGGRATSGNTNQ